jgi:hypothetical protein
LPLRFPSNFPSRGTDARMKVVSLFSGCGGLDYGLHQVQEAL